MKLNQFLRMRRKIERIINDYQGAMAKYSPNETLHSETIERMANPFLKGSFTLAVVGRLSSGKSTFINTLIGADILPTGHFQTTSAITCIEYDTSAQMEVLYADGTKKIYGGSEIKSTLREVVAMPEKYKDLPINDINTLIIGGDDISEILNKKAGIERKTLCPVLDEALWKEYVESHPLSAIAKKVRIEYPLSEDLQGWEILDTPGVGAIGGIQDTTTELFALQDEDGNKHVDAIIFLQNGADNIQDLGNVTFVQEISKQLTNEAKKRLFFVLTHATELKFRSRRKEIMDEANKIYGVKYGLPEGRLTHVDSLMAKFHNDIVTQNIDVASIIVDEQNEVLEGWDKDECNSMYDLLPALKRELNERKLAVNNESLLSLMEEWGNFTSFKQIINDFVREVKESSVQKIISLVCEDYSLLVEQCENDIVMLESGESAIEEKRKSLTQKRTEYSKVLNELRRLSAVRGVNKKFRFIDNDLTALSQKVDNGEVRTIGEVRTLCQNTMDKAKRIEKETFSSIEENFKSYCNEFHAKDIILRQIDFAALVEKAREASTIREDVYRTETYREGRISPEEKRRRVYAGTKERHDERKMLREFTAYVINTARSIKTSFTKEVKEEVGKLCDFVWDDIQGKLKLLDEHLELIKNQQSNGEHEISERKKHIENINNIKNKISEYENE